MRKKYCYFSGLYEWQTFERIFVVIAICSPRWFGYQQNVVINELKYSCYLYILIFFGFFLKIGPQFILCAWANMCCHYQIFKWKIKKKNWRSNKNCIIFFNAIIIMKSFLNWRGKSRQTTNLNEPVVLSVPKSSYKEIKFSMRLSIPSAVIIVRYFWYFHNSKKK